MKYQRFSIGLLLVVLLNWGCTTNPPISKALTNTLPWPVSSPESEGVNPLVLDSIHQDILNDKYGLVDRFFALRNGKVIADYTYTQDYDSVMALNDTTNFQYNYDHTAWHPYYQKTDLHTMQSVTKSVTSILFGIAVDEGLIPNLDTSALTYFKEFQIGPSAALKQTITLEDLLTMRSGLQWDEDNYDEAHNSCLLMELSDDWIQFVWDNPLDTLPGQQFEYNSGASVLLGKIIREATGKRIDQWAEEKLFGPMGIEYYWKETPKGEIDTEGGLYLSTYDLAKIGYMMMQDGKWENQQMVSPEWVQQSLKASVQFNSNFGYGYQWWIPQHENGEMKIFAGNGYGGQFVMGVPEKDLLVVFNGWQHHGQPQQSTWLALQDRILPGLQD